ncbi:MAG: sigma-70 family RNA polymerase sigma factor, partial [Gaiellaceae bacterium]
MEEVDVAIRLPVRTSTPTSLPLAAATDSIPDVDGATLTDGDLLGRIGIGDSEAFEELYRRYARAVLALALRRIGDRGRAEDATQEVFAAVWRSARSYNPSRGAGSSWLFAIARNAIVDSFRKRPEPIAEPPDLPSTEAGPAEQTEAGWVSWRIHRALETVPEHERNLIELAYWSGLSQSEIAAFLNLPLGTVKTRTR